MKKQVPKEAGKSVHFTLASEPGSHVFVAGTFNHWSPTATPLHASFEGGHFKTVLHVPPGTHEYKFVVNGVWTVDPLCQLCAPNAFGTQNSVLHV